MGETKKKLVKCLVCGAVFEEGVSVCPVCGVGPENFVPFTEEEKSFHRDTEELFLILGGGACYLLSVKGYDITIPVYVIAIVAGLLIFVLNNIRRNVFINIGAGLWDSYNMLTGLLGDTLSYIRLFALGISSAVLGLVFNDLAMNMSPDIPGLRQLTMLIILLFGHSINLFMAGLGSFVHPMRLTFVEFYKNAGFEGGGKKYQPYKKRAG